MKADKRGTQAKKKVEDVKKSSSFVDPLSSLGPLASSFEGSDPLSKIASEGIYQAPRSTRTKVILLTFNTWSPSHYVRNYNVVKIRIFFSFKSEDGLDETFEPWSAKKAGILTKYTTSEKLSITTSFLSSADKEKSKSIMIK